MKEIFKDVYFITGTAYAGKSTMVKMLAEKHGGICCGENYQDEVLPELDKNEFPCLTYTRDLKDWHEFVRRTPEEYVRWLNGAKKECEIVELRILPGLVGQGKKIFVDTNICLETLREIASPGHVLIMLADPAISISRFFDRPDPEKQFIYSLLLQEPDPRKALDDYREMLTRINSREVYDELLHSGFPVILRDESRTPEETMQLAEKIFGLA